MGANMRDNFKGNFLNGILSDEEFDEFANELLQVEPPPWLVDAILSSIAQIPLLEMQSELLEQVGSEKIDMAPSA